jgi:hypothetical protein
MGEGPEETSGTGVLCVIHAMSCGTVESRGWNSGAPRGICGACVEGAMDAALPSSGFNA